MSKNKMNYLRIIFLLSFLLPAWATYANEIEDIKVEGLSVISLGTVLNYLPIELGDEYGEGDSKKIIQELYRTNFFQNISVNELDGVVTIKVVENPQIKSFAISGNQVIQTQDIDNFVESLELSAGFILNDYKLDELIRQIEGSYLAQGYYSSQITKKVTQEGSSSVNIEVEIVEGPVAKIHSMQIIGARSYSEDSLLSLIPIGEPSFFSYFTEDDMYSKVALNAGLEKIKSFYNNQGFPDFTVSNVNISLANNKRDVNISIEISEGDQYVIGEVIVPENKYISKSEFQDALAIDSGDLYNQKEIVESVDAMRSLVTNLGYFENKVDVLTNKKQDSKTIDLLFELTLKKRTYVNRIVIFGNTRTQDDVIRREIRQVEGAVYSEDNIKKSIRDLKSLGYFSDVQYETTPVKGSKDLVDLVIRVQETKTGSFTIGVSQSSNSGTSLNLGVAERNFLGSGNTLNAQIDQSEAVKEYRVSFTNPFFTEENHSLSYGIFYRELDADELDVSNYQIDSYGANLGYGIPLSDETRVNGNLKWTNYAVTCGDDFAAEEPQCEGTDQNEDTDLVTALSWNRSTLNSFYFPTDGNKANIALDVAVPGGDYRYYKTNTKYEQYFPLNVATTFKAEGAVSYAEGYSGEELPFFKRFYAGGSSSIRGFKFNSLGPEYPSGESKGGELLTTMGIAVITPVPLVQDSKNMRISAFIDGGNVYEEATDFEASDLRSAAGIAFSWITPIGPLGFYFATPLAEKDGDDTTSFEFSLGSVF